MITKVLATLCLLYHNTLASEGQSQKEDVETTTAITTVPSTTLPPSTAPTPTEKPQRRLPCICKLGTCNCCTGNLLSYFNYTMRNKMCVRVHYEPDDFEFQYKILFNQRVLYQNKLSGKNPPPVCLPIRWLIPATMCVRFTNVYAVGRNLHACVGIEAVWNNNELFNVGFDCFRIGSNGIALVKPEDGGGLPQPIVEEVIKPGDLDYNDSA